MSRLLTTEQQQEYRDNGYVILKNFFSEAQMELWEKGVIAKFAFQALRVGEVRKQLAKGDHPSNYTETEDLDRIVNLFEDIDPHAAFIANKSLADSYFKNKFVADSALAELASQVLSCPIEHLVIPGHYPAMFISIPGNPRLRYTWHSEKNCCFPKRRNLLTFWFPNFRDKNEINGTMFLKKGSYVKEYTYINAKAENSPLKQFYLPDFEHEEFEEVPMVCSRGDLVVFEGNMVHRSSANMSQETSYASVLRFFDYSKDMTLSAHENAGLQNHEDYGRFDLNYVDYSS